MEFDATRLEQALDALGELLDARSLSYELVATGGGGLLLLGLVERPTADLDIVALRADGAFRKAEELPRELLEAVRDVSELFGLDSDWVNARPADVFRLGLPAGFHDRLTTRRFGPLALHLVGRFDQVCLKLHAWVDRYPGGDKHLADLRRLEPTERELTEAARWAMTHDPSPAFRDGIVMLIQKLGVSTVDEL